MPYCTRTTDPCTSCVRGPCREQGNDICASCRSPEPGWAQHAWTWALDEEHTAWELGDHWEPASWTCNACGEPESVHGPSHEVQGLTYCHRCVPLLLAALDALRKAGLLVYPGGQMVAHQQDVPSGERDVQRPEDWYGALLAWAPKSP